MSTTRKVKSIFALAICTALLVSTAATTFAEVNTPQNPTDFSNWKATEWDNKAQFDSGHVVLTPGKDATEMNFAWYSKVKGNPEVRISTKQDMSGSKTFKGTATSITAANGTNTYAASNKVTATGLAEKTVYFYSYSTDDLSWSTPASVNTQSTSALKLIYVGDPQIGASTGSNGVNIANDTFQWNSTIQTAVSKNPDTNFILSAGDQINQADASNASKVRRELEYAGFLYPKTLTNFPLAATVGNHESLVGDYQQHYNNPNSSASLGSTAAGSDYYFNYGNVLFIILNSNNRNSAEHDKLMTTAVNDSASKNAQWKIVMFHHDIYGSGEPHSDVDGANLRALFAPLMDKYNIDICLTGHDHSYTRTYQIIDGKVIDYNSSYSVANPQGTLYMTANSASGSKFYALNSTKQYYINKRDQQNHPNYSTIAISDSSFTIQTFDAVNGAVIDKYTISKNTTKQSLSNLIEKANSIIADKSYVSTYTMASRKVLKDALIAANSLLETDKDGVPEGFFGNYNKSFQGDNPNDKLSYYASDRKTGKRVETGYSAFIDKTINNSQSAISGTTVNQVSTALNSAINELVKISVQGSSTVASTNSNSSEVSVPKTEDHTDAYITAMIAIMSFAVVVTLIFKAKRCHEN